MKITKNELRKIIKEERQKLLVEMNPMMNADRALSGYSSVSTTDALQDAILKNLQQTEMSAVDDGMDEDEAEEMARAATILAVANSFESAGLIDVKMALIGLLR
jgi:hypothetical protein